MSNVFSVIILGEAMRRYIKAGYSILLNALFSSTHEITYNKRKQSCALDIHLYGHVYNNV